MMLGMGWGGVGGLTTLMCGGVHDVGGVVWWRSCCWGWGGVGGLTTLMCGNAVGFKPTHWADDMTWLR